MPELIVALDVQTCDKALALASSLKDVVSWFKVGLELFVAHGPHVVRELKNMGRKIFLDLKFYDIPNTVAQGVRSACELEVDMLTIHCQGGRKMCEAALASAQEYSQEKLLVFGVTVLTSFSNGEMPGLKIPAAQYAFDLAGLAYQWKLPGIVCSGLEVERIKSLYPNMLCLCPGIRPQSSPAGDQRRTVTPAEAVKAGANYLVVGRPITQALDPVLAARTILKEMSMSSDKHQ